MIFLITFVGLQLALLVGCWMFLKSNREFYRSLRSSVVYSLDYTDSAVKSTGKQHSPDGRIFSDFDDIKKSLRESSEGLENLIEGQREILSMTDELVSVQKARDWQDKKQ